jgi:hypothetical protein
MPDGWVQIRRICAKLRTSSFLEHVHTLPILRSKSIRLTFQHTASVLVVVQLTYSSAITSSFASSTSSNKSTGFTKNDAGSSGNLKITNGDTYAVQPDPKHPGKFLWKMWSSGFVLLNPGSEITVTVKDVSALLYQNQMPAAKMHAPTATYDNNQKTIDATGGVVVNSLTEPGTTLRADRVVFYAATSKIVATGHVVYHNAKTQIELHTNELVGDTKLKTLRSDSGGSVALPKGL